MGRVIDAYGIRGWIKIAPFNDPRESVLRACRRWWLSDGRALVVERSRVHGATLVAHPLGCDDRAAAASLKGLAVRVSRADFPAGRSDEYYWVDLVGCRVSDRQDRPLGEVVAVEDYGAHPILVLRDAAGRSRMVPFVDAWIVEVDPAARRIVADWPAEL